VETRVTTDRPYSADAVNETLQVLADGNRISRRSVTKVYRDGAGRTRREMLNDDGTVRSITISDPVGHVSYTLDPKAKAAFKASRVVPTQVPPGGTYTVFTGVAEVARAGGRGGRGAGVGSGSGSGTGSGTATGTTTATASGGGRGGRGGVVVATPRAGGLGAVNNEELGPQNIEGVMAGGARTTTTIPAGQIGNAQEIKIVSERWFSDELEVLVMTKHSDPRSGETTYRLTNILRAEPDPSLFTVPADYTIQDRNLREVRR
jgi:hypothetical protein